MHENSTQKLNDIAYLFSQIQKHANALSGNAAGIIQEFFDSQFSISDISEIYELPKDEVKKTISDFLVELLARKHGLQRFLSISCVEGKDKVVDPRKEANLLIEICETPESTAAKIREVIGTAVRISIPPMPPNLCAETISKVNAIIKPRKGDFLELLSKTLLRISEAFQLSEQEKKELLFLSGQQPRTQKSLSTPVELSVGVTLGSGVSPKDITVSEFESPAVIAVQRLLADPALAKEERKRIEDHILNLVSLLQDHPKAISKKKSSSQNSKTKRK